MYSLFSKKSTVKTENSWCLCSYTNHDINNPDIKKNCYLPFFGSELTHPYSLSGYLKKIHVEKESVVTYTGLDDALFRIELKLEVRSTDLTPLRANTKFSLVKSNLISKKDEEICFIIFPSVDFNNVGSTSYRSRTRKVMFSKNDYLYLRIDNNEAMLHVAYLELEIT